MTNQLIAAYGLPDQVNSNYWLKLQPEKKEDDRATIDDAANLLDTLYDRNPCIDEQTGGEEPAVDETSSLEPPTDEDGFWEIIRGEIPFAACAENNCDLLLLRVYRSHLAEPYKLIFDNGEQRLLIQQSGPARQVITVAGERFADLDYPVAGNLKYQWSSVRDGSGGALKQPPLVEADGARLVFGRTVTGILIAEYDTAYDLVTVAVPRTEEGKPGECHVLAYYAGTITEEDLQAEEIDESMDSVAVGLACTGQGKIDMPDKPYSCYERVYNRILCRCDGKESGKSYYTEPDVSCPEHWDPEHVSAGRHLIGSRSVIRGYISCPGEGDDNTMQDHLDICCVSGTPPRCDTSYSLYHGGKGVDVAAIRAEYGHDVVLVPVGPKDGVCGIRTTKYKKPNFNCCDEVPELLWDYDNSAEVIGDNSSALVFVNDTRGPYQWKVRGEEFFTDSARTSRDAVTSQPVLRIYTGDSCGICYIEVTDGCTHAIGMVRAATGHWMDLHVIREVPEDLVSRFEGPSTTPCCPDADECPDPGTNGVLCMLEQDCSFIKGKYWAQQVAAVSYNAWAIGTPNFYYTEPQSGLSLQTVQGCHELTDGYERVVTRRWEVYEWVC